MSPAEFRSILARSNLSQVGAARLLGVADYTVRRWAKDGVDGPVAILWRLLDAGVIDPDDIAEARMKIS